MSDAPLMLSVSGLRGLVGRSLTPTVASRYAAAFGRWLQSRASGSAPHVVLAHDSRPSGQMIELAAAAGLIAVGCRVTSIGVVTTPGAAIMTEQLHADGGMVITASHNPIEWNGIKALRHDGVAPAADEAKRIIDAFGAADVAYVGVDALQPLQHDDTAHRVHVDCILPHVDVEAIRRRRFKVAVDSVHGAGGPETAMLLDALGVELVHLYAEPTGQFPHTPEPLRENLTALCDAVKQHGADIGFAQDPDADRLAIVDEQGQYIGEEYTLALACRHMLATRGQPGDAVAANLSTSRMIDDIAAEQDATVVRTPVGEANVAAAMRRHDALIGGEGNGGVIWPRVVCVRDSLVGIALVLEMLATSEQPLSGFVEQIPCYAIIKQKVDAQPGLADALTDAMRHAFDGQTLDEQDGVRVDWPDRWVHVRPSNTEPIVRIIAEAPTSDDANELIDRVRDALQLNSAAH